MIRKISAFVLSLGVLVVFSNATSADSVGADGNGLLVGCNSALTMTDHPDNMDVDVLRAGYCLGLVSGIGSTISSMENKKSRSICFPKEVSVVQSVRVVVKFLNDHPEKLHIKGDYLAIFALQNAYPCK